MISFGGFLVTFFLGGNKDSPVWFLVIKSSPSPKLEKKCFLKFILGT